MCQQYTVSMITLPCTAQLPRCWRTHATTPHAASLLCLAVVDKWGYSWSGGGTYIKDFGGATGRQHILIRFNTEDISMGIQYFPVAHETNVRFLAPTLPFCLDHPS
jgi:hypothetical protein